jgi:hypothetical protein
MKSWSLTCQMNVYLALFDLKIVIIDEKSLLKIYEHKIINIINTYS